MPNVGTLSVNVVANTGRFSTGMRTARREVTGFTAGVNKSMRVLTPFSALFGAGIGLGITTAFIQMGKSANEFAGAMNRSLAIMTDVSAEMRREMEATAHTVAYTSQFSSKQAAEAYFYLASAGMSAQQSLKAMPAVARFAQAGNFDLALATDLATDAQSALGLRVEDTEQNLRNLTYVTDVLTKANTLANASIQQFSEAITQKAGAATRLYGLELEDTIGMIAAFADQGIKGADAGTRVDIVLRDLTTKAIRNKAAFKEMEIAVFDAFGELRKPYQIIRDMERAFGGLSAEMKKTAILQLGFADKSASATASLLGYSTFMEEVTEKTRDAGGTTKDVADNVLTPFDKSWQRLTATVQAFGAEALPPVLDQLADLMDTVGITASSADELKDSLSGYETIGEQIGIVTQAFVDLYNVMDRASSASRELPLWEYMVNPQDAKQQMQNYREWYDKNVLGVPDLVGEGPRLEGLPTGGPELMADLIEQATKTGATRRRESYDVPDFRPMLMAEVQAREELDKERERYYLAEEDRHEKYQHMLAEREVADAIKAATERQQAWNEQVERANAIIADNRTPLEQFKTGLADLDKLLDSGALSDWTAAAREVARLKKTFIDATQREQETRQPGFAPAIGRNDLQAYEAIIKAQFGAEMREPAEETAAAMREILNKFPQLLRVLNDIKRKTGKPEMVEVPAR